MLRHALKEWAVICKALEQGKQALLLRKGGIAETGGEFQVEHKRFWLFPTFVHQQKEGIRPEALALLDEAERERFAPGADAGLATDGAAGLAGGVIRLSHFAEITGVYHVHDLVSALILAHLHFWSADTVRRRFEYRSPSLYVMPVRVYRAGEVHELADKPEYQGCRSWVTLEQGLSTERAVPVLPESAMEDLHRSLDLLLKPTALA